LPPLGELTKPKVSDSVSTTSTLSATLRPAMCLPRTVPPDTPFRLVPAGNSTSTRFAPVRSTTGTGAFLGKVMVKRSAEESLERA